MYLICVVCVMVYLVKQVQMASIVRVSGASGTDNIVDKENENIPGAFDKEVFRMPRTLKVGDKISVRGKLKTNRERLTVNLAIGQNEPDFNNIMCQVKVNFPTEASNIDVISLNSVVDGTFNKLEEDLQSTKDLFSSKSNEFAVTFNIMKNSEIGVNLNDGYDFRNDCPVQNGIQAIKYVTVGGDVRKVDELNFLMG